MALHEQSVGKTDEWYTPPHVFEAMGATFDLDVAAPFNQLPWIPAAGHIYDRSLERAWAGFVWMNPPFGGRNALRPWLAKFLAHGNGVALVPDRTSAPWWREYVEHADAVLLVHEKLKFIGVDGKPGGSPAQGTALLAMGDRGLEALHNAQRARLGTLWMAFPMSEAA